MLCCPTVNIWRLSDNTTMRACMFPNEVVGLCIEKGLSLIAAWRTHSGLSQNDLAARMDITQPAVAQLEKPDSKPQRRTLKKAAKALGICVEQLTE